MLNGKSLVAFDLPLVLVFLLFFWFVGWCVSYPFNKQQRNKQQILLFGPVEFSSIEFMYFKIDF